MYIEGMSKKHFEAAAARIAGLRKVAALIPEADARAHQMAAADGAEAIVIALGQEFNPRFDVARFHAACQP